MRTVRFSILLSLLAAPAAAQTISRTPVTPPRPVAIHREPKPAPAPERPETPVVIVDGYNPGWIANYGYYPLPYAVPVYASYAPPAPPPEVASPAPAPAMAWIRGAYQWNGAGFNWQPGRWVAIPAGYLRWVDGRWQQNQHGYYWVNGYWAF